jgi:methionyl-tRNA formyltransferase
VKRLRLIFAGSSEFGLPTLQALMDAGHEIAQVVTQPDRPAGRGRALLPTPIATFAVGKNLPVLKTPDVNRETLPDTDAMLVIAFGQKIAAAQANRPRLGSMNLHASLLPRYRGAAPITWAILRGEAVTGNTIIRLAQRMDAGAMLGQSVMPIGEVETGGELHDRLAQDGAALVLRTLLELETGTAIETPQDESAATLAPKLSRKDAVIDFARPAAELARLVRGLFPWLACRVGMADANGYELARVRLVRARVVVSDESPRWEAGEIMLSGWVNTGEGALEILELQPEAGRVMTLEDYRRGHRWLPGMKLSAIQ